MAIGIYFSPQSMSPEQYDDVITRLEAAGQAAPSGRLSHAAFEADNGLHVFDVWESQESFDTFGETLMPILGQVGVDPGQPHVSSVHNFISG
jgi:hypothetical protein